MNEIKELLLVEKSRPLEGVLSVPGAKNAVLVSMISLLLAKGKSILRHVPYSDDVINLSQLLRQIGADVVLNKEEQTVSIDASTLSTNEVDLDLLKKMRASVLVAGALLARLGRAKIAVPGGCKIGKRPIDFHLKAFRALGIEIIEEGEAVALVGTPRAGTIVLEYPSVGATENALMAAVFAQGETTIIDAAIEPEVLDLINLLRSMGADIEVAAPATITIRGVAALMVADHAVMPDRLEAGSLLIAAAVTGGTLTITNAIPSDMDVFLYKLQEMGHQLDYDRAKPGVTIRATKNPVAVSFKTGPFPGFPTDLQSPMMAAQCLAEGESVISETVFENRMLHVPELIKMGASIELHGSTARVTGVKSLRGTYVEASDIRASCALVIAGLAAEGTTSMSGLHHWRRGYEKLEQKLASVGASITLVSKPLHDLSNTEARIREL
jgi:UDP-N-acetylglucosamine 1-carboxyvinyltransferase